MLDVGAAISEQSYERSLQGCKDVDLERMLCRVSRLEKATIEEAQSELQADLCHAANQGLKEQRGVRIVLQASLRTIYGLTKWVATLRSLALDFSNHRMP